MIMHTTVKFAKVRPTAKIPTKRVEDAGYDIYADFEEPFILINPHETVMIPTGIASACDTDYCFVLKERGSTGTKGIAQRCGIIDSGYRGEIKAIFRNTTDVIPAVFQEGERFCQLVIVPIPNIEVVEASELSESDRGENGYGSTGKDNISAEQPADDGQTETPAADTQESVTETAE